MYLGTAIDTTSGSFVQGDDQEPVYTVQITGANVIGSDDARYMQPAPSAQPLLIVGAVLLALWMLGR